jgi:ABC-type multidrug transport system ATPase subunit
MLVARSLTNQCVNCKTANWGYPPAELHNDQTLQTTKYTLICANCLTLVAKTQDHRCVSCKTQNWGYSNTQLATPDQLIQANEVPALLKQKRRFNTGKVPVTSPNVAIEAIAISKVVGSQRVILQELSLTIEQGEFIALMGPSGCGKTTLLQCLNGVGPATDGTVKIHGLDLIENYELLKRKIGYVPQKDIVHKELTVDQTLFYAAKLRLPDDTSEAFITQRIDDVLTSLKINRPDIRKTKVGALSGGQVKRVCIAVELLNDPTILFMDEPTSPLDPETIEEFLKCIRGLAKDRGTTIIMVTHKPDDLNYVDKVVFMGMKGYMLYHGDRRAILQHFGKHSLIQIYSHFSSDENVNKLWYEKWNNQPLRHGYKKQAPSLKKTKTENPFRQWFWLSVRYLHLKVSNIKNFIFLLAQPLFVAIVLQMIYNQFELSILFLIAVSTIWFGVNNSATEIVEELPVYTRERMVTVGIIPYIASKLVVLLMIAFVQMSIFLSVLWFAFQNSHVQLVNLPDYLLFTTLLSVSAILFGLLFSSALPDKSTVMTIIPLSLIPQIIFAGVVASIDNTLKLWGSYLWLGRWGTLGLAHIQDKISFPIKQLGQNQMVVMKDSAIRAITQLRMFPSDYKIEEHWSYSLESNVAFLIGMCVATFIAIWYFLKRKDKLIPKKR